MRRLVTSLCPVGTGGPVGPNCLCGLPLHLVSNQCLSGRNACLGCSTMSAHAGDLGLEHVALPHDLNLLTV